jgi:uncharacterized membrane protein
VQSEENWGPSSDDRLWAALDYLFTPVVPAIVLMPDDKRQRPFIRAHNAQALALVLIQLGLLVLSSLVGCLTTVPMIALLLVQIVCAVQAYGGKAFALPVIGSLAGN